MLCGCRQNTVHFKHNSGALRAHYNTDQKDHLREHVENVAEYINYMSGQTALQVKAGVKLRVEEAYKIAWNIYSENHEHRSPIVIQKMIKDALRPIRFHNGRGYYFAFTLGGVEELFADRPELEGTNMLNVQGANGEYVVRDMLILVQKQKEGFYEYTWSKPNEHGKHYSKLAYVKLFEPYGWVLGTGEYLDDTAADIQNEVLERISSLRFDDKGYCFGSTMEGSSLFSNGKISRGANGNILNLKNIHGVKIIQEQIRTVTESPEGGFVFYSWNKIGEKTSTPKMSYVVAIPEWQWVVGAGIYLDTVDAIIAENRVDLKNNLLARIKQSGLILLTLAFVIFLCARQFAGQIKNNARAFGVFFEKAASGSVFIDENTLHYAEFQTIAQAANQMVEERRSLQSSLQESEQRHRSMFWDSHSVMLIIDSETEKIIDANPAACDFYGYDLQTLQNMKIGDIRVLSAEQIALEVERVTQAKQHYFTFQHRLANGDIRDVEIYSGPLLVRGKTILFSIIHDITKRKHIEDALKNSEENLALVQMVASVGSWTYDVASSELFWSDEVYRICGVDKDSFPAKYESYLAMVHSDDRQKFRKLTQTALATKENYTVAYRIIRPSTQIINIYEQGAVICNGKGDILKLVGTIQDITEKKKLEEELFQAQKMEAIGTLAGGIAHDFNNILSAILGYSEIAKAELPAESRAARDIDQVLIAGKRATELVKQILTFSRKTNQQIKPLRIDLIVKEALKMLRSSLPVIIKIQDKISKDVSLVLADPTSIHQIVMNLCTNAFHALDNEKGLLCVELFQRDIGAEEIAQESEGREGSYVTLMVRDSGRGMTEDIVDRIFDPYFTTKEVGKGTGLGLSVIHGIVAGCGGFIQVESTPGQGSTFLVNLPAIEELQRDSIATVPEEKLPGGTETILFVDDEPLLVEMDTIFLERVGYKVVPLTDPLSALEQFKADPASFDLIITDQTMPGITGAEMALAMLEIRPELPVILCTGYSSVLSEQEALAIGIKRFETKPVTRATLLEMVREVLDEKQQQ